jgi:type 1 fimbriae regulatory protein FimB/type 1 fimbriae regulatory protein FimE
LNAKKAKTARNFLTPIGCGVLRSERAEGRPFRTLQIAANVNKVRTFEADLDFRLKKDAASCSLAHNFYGDKMKNTAKNTPKRRRVAQFAETGKLAKQKTRRIDAKAVVKRSVKRGAKKSIKKRLPGGELDETMYLEQEEKDAFFSVIESHRDTALFRIAYHRGLRAHEVGLLAMTDFRGDHLHVHRGKGSRSAIYPLTRVELHALKLWLRDRGNAPGPIFLSRQHRQISRRRLDQLMKHYCELAGIDPAKAHMHALKHSCGTHLAERGNPADGIQGWLGHKDIRSTQIYMHFSRRRRDEMAQMNVDWK